MGQHNRYRIMEMTIQSGQYNRRILLAVTGMSPQVMTETLYVLAVQKKSFIPTEIHLVTTKTGEDHARLNLLADDEEKPGHFHELCRLYDLPPIDFDHSHIHVVADVNGKPLHDIRTDADNSIAADFITRLVRDFTADENASLHVSMAGGRKTMGYYMGYALSLYGRAQDCLSHVLVNDPFESHTEFYYPTPRTKKIHDRNGLAHDCKNAKVELADIPYVRLRDGLPTRLQTGEAGFSETVQVAQRALRPPELIIDLDNRKISMSGEVIEIAASELAFYSWMARRLVDGRDFVRHDDDGIDAEYLEEYALIVGKNSGDYERAEEALKRGMDSKYFEQRKSKTITAINRVLPPQLAAKYVIIPHGKRPHTRFGLSLDPLQVRYEKIND